MLEIDQDLSVVGHVTNDHNVGEVISSRFAEQNIEVVIDSDDSDDKESAPVLTWREMQQAQRLRRGLYGRDFIPSFS